MHQSRDMRIIEFIPKVGIAHIPFGATREHVRAVMQKEYSAGAASPRDLQTDCYFENALQFSFEQDNTLSFITAASPPPVCVQLLGINTWEVSGQELLKRLMKIDPIGIDLSEDGEIPVFPTTWIALWELDEQYDYIGGYKTAKWGAIGIGDRRYYEAMCKIDGVKP